MFFFKHVAPLKRTSPTIVPVVFRPASTSIRDVFPHPLLPKRAVSRPARKWPVRPCRITLVPSFLVRTEYCEATHGRGLTRRERARAQCK